MTKRVKARLGWKIPKPPKTNRFVVPARFGHQGDDWKENCWSLVIESQAPLDMEPTQQVTVQFLMDTAPNEWLFPGQTFALMEGDRILAEGTIE